MHARSHKCIARWREMSEGYEEKGKRWVRFDRSTLGAHHAPRTRVNTACIYLFITRLASNRDKGLVAGGSRIRRRVYARMRSIPLPFDHLHIHTRIIKSPKSREIEARKACPILDHLSCCFPSPALQFTPSVPVIPSLFPSLAVQRIKPINESTPRLVFELKKSNVLDQTVKMSPPRPSSKAYHLSIDKKIDVETHSSSILP